MIVLIRQPMRIGEVSRIIYLHQLAVASHLLDKSLDIQHIVHFRGGLMETLERQIRMLKQSFL